MLYVLVGATLVASICNSRLKSLLQFIWAISPFARNDKTPKHDPLRLCASAVKQGSRSRPTDTTGLAALAPVILMSNAG